VSKNIDAAVEMVFVSNFFVKLEVLPILFQFSNHNPTVLDFPLTSMSRFVLDYIIVLGVERLLQWYTRPTHMAILCGFKIKWGHGAPRSKKAWYWEG
jgi:nitric oxide synthase oxygenase domain/subunit